MSRAERVRNLRLSKIRDNRFTLNVNRPAAQESPVFAALRLPNRERADPSEEIFDQAYKEDLFQLKDFEAPRLLTVWRIIRAFFSAQGKLYPDTPLSSLPFSSWQEPLSPDELSATSFPLEIKKLILNLSEHRYWPEQEKAGLTILPPPPPTKRRSKRYRDLTETYVELLGLIAEGLGVSSSETGRFSLYGLTDPNYVLDLFPMPSDVIAFETEMIEVATEELAASPFGRASKVLSKKFLLTRPEAKGLIDLALVRAEDLVLSSDSQNRALIVLRLEDLMHRAREEGNLREEGNALKQLAQTLGVSQPAETNDFSAMFRQITARITEQDHEHSKPGSLTMGTEPKRLPDKR